MLQSSVWIWVLGIPSLIIAIYCEYEARKERKASGEKAER